MSGMYEDIYEAISAHQAETGIGEEIRLMKLTEEVGETMQAYIGFMGANKRKGKTHSELDIAKELCDVVITAMVALHDWVEDESPELFLKGQVTRVLERVKKVGS
jgi:hypothetical protein